MGARTGRNINVANILGALDDEHSDARLALDFATPFQLLVALILAAQSTDAKINEITETLFDEFSDPAAFADADSEELERAIHSSGFYRQKARTLRACCRRLVDDHAGSVPEDLDVLLGLPGIGRKTANILRGNAWGIPGIGVDTHVSRLSQRLSMTTNRDPDKIEADLVTQIPVESQIRFCHLMQYHGRRVCHARKPNCAGCAIAAWCPFPEKTPPDPAQPAPTRSSWV